MNNIDTSMYYTFSTIAQVLASFLSLSAVFVIYQLQEYSKEQFKLINSYIKILQEAENASLEKNNITNENIKTTRKLSSFYIEFNENELIDTIIHELKSEHNNFLANRIRNNNDIEIKLSEKIALIEFKKNKLKKLTKTSIIIGIFSICLSLLIIPTIPYLSSCICLSVVIIVLTLISSLTSITIMGIGITNAISSKKILNR